MGEIFCVWFQGCPLKILTKYLTHALKDIFLYNIEILRAPRFKSSYTFFWPWVLSSVCVAVCVCQSVCQSLACQRDNSWPIQARIDKFGPKMQKTLVKVPIVFGYNWPWPSRSACPHNNSLPIQARITTFGPKVENSLVRILIVLGGNWPWPSRSNLI